MKNAHVPSTSCTLMQDGQTFIHKRIHKIPPFRQPGKVSKRLEKICWPRSAGFLEQHDESYFHEIPSHQRAIKAEPIDLQF